MEGLRWPPKNNLIRKNPPNIIFYEGVIMSESIIIVDRLRGFLERGTLFIAVMRE